MTPPGFRVRLYPVERAIVAVQRCWTCGDWLSVVDFYVRRQNAPFGRQHHCKRCLKKPATLRKRERNAGISLARAVVESDARVLGSTPTNKT